MNRTRRADHTGHSRPQLLAPFVTAAWVLFSLLNLCAQEPKPTEYQVKAAYLYNFGRFVQWPARFPAATDDSFYICVLGQDPFGVTLDAALAGATIDGKSLVAKRISRPQESVHCHILFVSSSEDKQLNNVLATIDKAGVLTVSEMPHFSRRGGMIQFVSEGNRVRFEVNLTAAGDAGLTLSSELLKLAITVRTGSQPGD